MPLIRLIYASSATQPFSRSDLEDLLARSRTKNHEAGLTGMLLHKDGNFMQVLEGEESDVRELFDRIGRDPRHRGIFVLATAPITSRDFDEWTMAFRELNDPGVRAIPGYSEFLNTPLNDPKFQQSPSMGHRLLLLFKKNLR